MKISLKQGGSDMTEGVIWKQLLEFSMPMALGLLFQQLYNTVDAVVVGRYVGKAALAAVGSTGNIVNMMVGICAGLSVGASVVISQCYGAKDHKQLQKAVHTTIAVTLMLCVAATAVGMLIVKPMLILMDTPEDVFPQAQQYLTIYFAGMAGLLIYNVGSGILRAVGDSRRPLFFLCFSAVVNIIFDLLFVVRFRMGVAGAAYATIISEFLSAVLVLVSLTKTKGSYGIRWKMVSVDRAVLRKILAIGLPSSFQQAVTSFSNVFVQAYINAYSSACMAGWSGYNKLDVFLVIPLQSIAMASTTFVGQNYGANRLSRARQGVRQAVTMSVVITAVLSVLLILFAQPLLLMFNTEEDVVAYGVRFITLISPFYVTHCFNQTFAGALRGVGNSRTPMIIMLCSFVAFRQIYLFVTKLLGFGFLAVAYAYPAGWVVCSVLMLIFYKKSVLCHPEIAPVRHREPKTEY